MTKWNRLLAALVAVVMLLTMPIMTGISRAAAEDAAPENGTLTVSKEVVNGDEDLEFNFEAALTFYNDPAHPWDSGTVTYINWMMYNSGVFTDEQRQAISQQFFNVVMNGSDPAAEIIVTTTFTLKHGESVEFDTLPGGTDYTITEAGTEGYVPSADGQTAAAGASLTVTGTIDGEKTLAFVNTISEDPTYESGTLTVSKEVVNGDTDLAFDFELTVTMYRSTDPWSVLTVAYLYSLISPGGIFAEDDIQPVIDQLNAYLNGSSEPLDEISFSTTFTLKHGESVEIPLKGGATYTVTEAGTEGYVPSADGQTAAAGANLTVTGTIDGNKTLAFVNTYGETPVYEDGTLTVTKTNVGGNADDKFTFILKIVLYTNRGTIDSGTITRLASMKQSNGGMFDDNEIQAAIDMLWDYIMNTGSGESVESVNFSATFTLKGGESITTTSLFGGADYMLTEMGVEGYVPSANGQTAAAGASLTVTGTIDGDKTLAFVNTYGETPVYESGTLTVSKKVVNGDEDLEFNFDVALTFYKNPAVPWDMSMVSYMNWMMQNSGVFTNEQMQAISQQFSNAAMNDGDPVSEIIVTTTFTLKHGESVEFDSLPGGTDYTITEAGTEGYVATANGQRANLGRDLTVTGTIDGDATVAYKNVVPRVGGGLTISKEVVNGDADQEFNFELTIAFHNDPDYPWTAAILSSAYAMLHNSGLFTSEEADAIIAQLAAYCMNAGDAPDPITATTTFTLKQGESKTFSSLLGGTEYTITETGTAGYIPSANGQTGTAGGDLTVSGVIDGNQAVAFTNTYTDYPAFKTQALGLEGLIGVHFFVYLPEISGFEYEGVAFEIDNTDGPDTFVPFSSDMPKNENGYYRFTYYVRSIEMADTITATLKFKVDGEDRTIEKLYSVKQYFETFDDYTFLFTDLEQDMTRATADYGHYVQAFLETTRTWVIGVDYTEMDKHYVDYTSDDIIAAQTGLADYVTAKTTGSNMEKITYTLVLDSGTELRVYFKPAADYTGTFTFTVNGETVTEDGDKISVKLQSDGRYLVAIKDVAAHELYRVFEVKAVGDDGVESSMTLSALSYVNAMMTAYAGNEKAINAAVAIWRYAMAAAALRPSEH